MLMSNLSVWVKSVLKASLNGVGFTRLTVYCTLACLTGCSCSTMPVISPNTLSYSLTAYLIPSWLTRYCNPDFVHSTQLLTYTSQTVSTHAVRHCVSFATARLLKYFEVGKGRSETEYR